MNVTEIIDVYVKEHGMPSAQLESFAADVLRSNSEAARNAAVNINEARRYLLQLHGHTELTDKLKLNANWLRHQGSNG